MLLPVTLYALAAFGFAFIVGHSKISLRFRDWLATVGDEKQYPETRAFRPPLKRRIALFLLELIECPACLGFWIGIACANFSVFNAWFVPGTKWWMRSFALGLVTTALNLLLAKATGLLDGSSEER